MLLKITFYTSQASVATTYRWGEVCNFPVSSFQDDVYQKLLKLVVLFLEFFKK